MAGDWYLPLAVEEGGNNAVCAFGKHHLVVGEELAWLVHYLGCAAGVLTLAID